jgi:putative ABC transport system ATP-binding protein
MIEVENVRKSYRSGEREVHALRGVSCRIAKGRFAFIVGPSGSGKSTLLYLLGALDRPSSGTIHVEGRELTSMSEVEHNAYRRDKIGFIFQSFNLINNLTALENVLVPFLPRGVSPAMRQRALQLLDEVGLGDRVEHRPYQMSGGEQQRVAIARALGKEPVLVTHDRRFITPDDLVLEIQDGELKTDEPAESDPQDDLAEAEVGLQPFLGRADLGEGKDPVHNRPH